MKPLFTKKILFIVVFIIVLVLIFNLVKQISHSNKAKVSVLTLPTSAKIYINDKKQSGTSFYLKDGQYNFKSKADGYNDDSIDITIKNKENRTIVLLPEPASGKIKQYISDHPNFQRQREALGGKKSDLASQSLVANNPIVSKLPKIDIADSFTLGYELKQSNNKVRLTVTDSSPNGRRNALKWIASEGDDPANYSINFMDFTNPLTLENEAEQL